jgi:tetrahydromethanopterin S-methyltransferase subunit G
MDIKEAVGSVLKDLIVPELDKIKEENKEIKATLVLTNKRLDDINLHIADQSRRIDSVREELSQRIDETNNRIDSVREELTQRIDRLYEVIVRRDEHHKLDERVGHLEREVNELKRMAA